MTDKILLKRSLTSGSIPSTSSLDVGELAINVPDGKLYLKQSGSQGEAVRSLLTLDTPMSGSVLLTGSVTTTQQITAPSFTGSLFGTSSWATNAISASYASNAELLDGLNSTVFATTGSNTFNGNQTISGSLLTNADTLILTGSMFVSGTLFVSNIITGSLFGTASVATTSSYALTASYIDGGYY